MGLNDETKEALVAAMQVTKKNLPIAFQGGGFFYFVGDASGEDGALIIFNTEKDADGKKTARIGRGLLKDFKKGGSKPFYSEGQITTDDGVVFNITKGNAKPATIKRAFKTSALLGQGVGAMFSKLKGVKFKMAPGATETEDEAPPSVSTTAPTTAALETWKDSAEIQALIKELSLTDDELQELFAAEQAFAAHIATLPTSDDEDIELQIRQAETEALLDELAEGGTRLEELKLTDPGAALTLETALNEKRVELARKNGVGPDPFSADVLTGPEKEALTASIRAGLELLLARVTQARAEIDREQQALQNLTAAERQEAQARLDTRRRELATELDSIEKQLRAATT